MYITWYSVYTYVHPKNYLTNFKKVKKIIHCKKEVQDRHKIEEQAASKKEV